MCPTERLCSSSEPPSRRVRGSGTPACALVGADPGRVSSLADHPRPPAPTALRRPRLPRRGARGARRRHAVGLGGRRGLCFGRQQPERGHEPPQVVPPPAALCERALWLPDGRRLGRPRAALRSRPRLRRQAPPGAPAVPALLRAGARARAGPGREGAELVALSEPHPRVRQGEPRKRTCWALSCAWPCLTCDGGIDWRLW